jgi:peptidoglycan/LPS O-acetylase OafA/YrhL
VKLTPRIVSAVLLALIILLVGGKIAAGGLIWLMGVAIHWLPVHKPATVLRGRVLLAAIILITVLTLAWCKSSKGDHSELSDIVLGVVVTALVYAILYCAQGKLAPTYTYLAQHMAKSSYTLYLVHAPVLVFLTAWIGQARWQLDAIHMLFGLGVLGAIFVYTQIVYFLFERNTGAIRRWLKPRLIKFTTRDQVA